ncbi:hypothetical protein ZWY2020_035852 [Hordeum vulgare]|nr:hypothetical protein ZWY2020_035852 [Hordeum vulgare]
MNASADISSNSAKGSFDVASVSIGTIDGLMSIVCGDISRVLTMVEHLSRADGILPSDHGFDAESLKETLSIVAEILAEIRQSMVHLRTRFGMFKQLQDARCKPFEDEARAIDDGARQDNILPESASAPLQEHARASDVSKFHHVIVDSEKLVNKEVTKIGFSNRFDRTEHNFPIGDGLFDGEQAK